MKCDAGFRKASVYLMSEPLWDEAWMRTGKEQRLPSTQQLEVELKMNQVIERPSLRYMSTTCLTPFDYNLPSYKIVLRCQCSSGIYPARKRGVTLQRAQQVTRAAKRRASTPAGARRNSAH